MLYVTTLFLDMNSYFASVEQHLRPALRGEPVAVAPMETDNTCCIAVSYEARPFGVKTGVGVGEAKKRCPRLRVVMARPDAYVRVHHQIVEAVETVLPVDQVCSIDEMSCRLSVQHRPVDRAVEIAGNVKQAIVEQVGASLRCSIGLATNRFLAKVGSNMQKPDGLTVITEADLPEILYPLALGDFPGIARGMLKRLVGHGIHTTEQLCSLSRQEMGEAWQSIVGQHWWHWLRGQELPTPPTHRRTVGHSHVLPPKYRNDEGTRSVFIRLIHKAAVRLRKLDYWARRLSISLSYLGAGPKWKQTVPLGRCQDTQTMLKAFAAVWPTRPRGGRPLKASITLFDLTAGTSMPLPLFAEERHAVQVAHAMDKINARFGNGSVYFASMHAARDSAPMRISFTHIPDLDEG